MSKRSRAKAERELTEKICRLFTAINSVWEPEHWLSRIEAATRAELERYTRLGVTGAKATPDEAAAMKDARDILCRIDALRGQLSRGETSGAVVNALLVGAAFERLGIWPLNPDIRRGSKVRLAAKAGGKARLGTDEERKAREQVIIEDFDRACAEQTEVYVMKAYEDVARRHQCSARTVMRIVRRTKLLPK